MFYILFILTAIIVLMFLKIIPEKFHLLKSTEIGHKSKQYLTFNYLKDLHNSSNYASEPSLNVYDEKLKEHYNKIMINR